MHFKLLNRFWLLLNCLFNFTTAALALDVAPFTPYEFDSSSGTDTIYLAEDAISDGDSAIDTGFTAYSATVLGSYVYLNVTDIDTTSRYIYLLADDAGTPVFVPLEASTDSTNCGTVWGSGFKCVLASGTETDIVIRFDLKAICNLNNAIDGCTAGNDVGTGSSDIFKFYVVARSTDGSADASTTSAPSFRVKLQSDAPTFTCPTGKKFFPGDQSVVISSGQFIAAAVNGGSPLFQKLIVGANRGALPNDGSAFATNTILSRLNYNNGEQEVAGFENVNVQSLPTTYYQLGFGVRDSSGAFTFDNTGCVETQAFATNIQGLLRDSNCFIATASFRSSRAAAVNLLREFRNQILLKYGVGRKFVSLYNQLGPIGADWLIEHPEFRAPVLAILMPIQVIAWLTLNPEFFWAVLFLALFFVILSIRARFSIRTLHLSSLAFVFFCSVSVYAESSQPYIDSLLSTLPKDELKRTNENPSPYIDNIKKKIDEEAPPTESGSYTENEKRKLSKDTVESQSYSQKLKSELGEDPSGGSAIADFKSGKQLKPNKGVDEVRGSFGFKFATAVHREYLAGSNQDRAYTEVYGEKWIPDVTISYELRPIQKGFWSGLGLYSGLGLSFVSAKGKLEFTDSGQFIGDSKTQFKFITLPLQLGAKFHMNWFNFLYPYFGGGPAIIGFIETRSDNQDGNRGYSFGYWGAAGVNFGIDWFSAEKSWDRYSSTGTKHAYLSLEYSYLNTVGNGLLDMSVDGLMAGFNFEF